MGKRPYLEHYATSEEELKEEFDATTPAQKRKLARMYQTGGY